MFNQDNPFFFFFKQGFFRKCFNWKMKAYSHNSEAVTLEQLCCTTVTRTLNNLNCCILIFLN